MERRNSSLCRTNCGDRRSYQVRGTRPLVRTTRESIEPDVRTSVALAYMRGIFRLARVGNRSPPWSFVTKTVTYRGHRGVLLLAWSTGMLVALASCNNFTPSTTACTVWNASETPRIPSPSSPLATWYKSVYVAVATGIRCTGVHTWLRCHGKLALFQNKKQL